MAHSSVFSQPWLQTHYSHRSSPSPSPSSSSRCMLGRHDAKSVHFDLRTRRQFTSFMLKFSAGFSFIATHHAALAAEIKKAKKVYTNLEEAREAGEKLREERDTAEGPIIILPSGVKFRELEPGTGRRVSLGYIVSVQYIIYKMNGLYLDSLGYGKEGKDDVGETLTFQFGKNLVPKAVELGMEGMQLGGRRRILVRPQLGWVNGDILPHPTSSAAQRRMLNNLKQPLLFEVELVKILPA